MNFIILISILCFVSVPMMIDQDKNLYTLHVVFLVSIILFSYLHIFSLPIVCTNLLYYVYYIYDPSINTPSILLLRVGSFEADLK